MFTQSISILPFLKASLPPFCSPVSLRGLVRACVSHKPFGLLMRPSSRVLLIPNLCFLQETMHPSSHLGHGVFARVGVYGALFRGAGDDILGPLRGAVGVALHHAKWTVSSVNDLMIMVTMTFLLNNERINVHAR
jgi:hypothetical protein